MARPRLQDRITDQFSYRSDRADVWRAFELVLDTDAFLNLGYSEWYQPHVVGSCQRRLVTQLGSRLVASLPDTAGERLLDVGCGRGGPAIHLADRFGFRVTGVDLVPYNVGRAAENAAESAQAIEWVVGDATRLPFASAAFAACTAIDVLVYLPDREPVFRRVADVLEPAGVFVGSDLVRRSGIDPSEQAAVDSFAEAWDMPSLGTVERYAAAIESTSLDLVAVEDVTGHSVGRFRKWTTLYLRLLGSPIGPLVQRLLRAADLDTDAITDQVRAAHRALPFLAHVVFVAKKAGPEP